MATEPKADAGAVVIDFPFERVDAEVVRKPSCMDCEHCTAGIRGLYCTLFHEWLIYDSVAEDCPQFEPL